MIRVEEVQGNVRHGFVPAAGSVLDELPLTRWDAQKRRLRKRTSAGHDVAISLARPGSLADGDVLYADGEVTIVARVESGEVLVLTLDDSVSPAALALNALRLGHVLGNQHWPLRLHRVCTWRRTRDRGAALARPARGRCRHSCPSPGRGDIRFPRRAPGEVLDEAPIPPAHLNDHAYQGHTHPDTVALSVEHAVTDGHSHAEAAAVGGVRKSGAHTHEGHELAHTH